MLGEVLGGIIISDQNRKGSRVSQCSIDDTTPFLISKKLIFKHFNYLYRASLLRKCWQQDPLQRPKPAEIVKTLIENPELVCACVGVPGTTLLDNSMENFDFRKTPAHARGGMGSPQSMHSMRSEHVSSTMALTPKEREDHVVRKHSTKPEAARTKRHPAVLWRKSSVHF